MQWGLSASQLDKNATGDSFLFTQDEGRKWATHTAVMGGLSPSTRYWYRVGGESTGWSQIFSFKSQVDATTLKSELPQVHLLFGDLGAAFGYSLCPDCTKDERCICNNRSAGIISETPDMILQTGPRPTHTHAHTRSYIHITQANHIGR